MPTAGFWCPGERERERERAEHLVTLWCRSQIIKPAVADAAAQAEYAADRITREAVMPLAEAVAGQVLIGLQSLALPAHSTMTQQGPAC